MTKAPRDLTMERFGDLIVLEKSESKGKNSFWLCKCKCGNEKIFRRDKLVYGTRTNCGDCENLNKKHNHVQPDKNRQKIDKKPQKEKKEKKIKNIKVAYKKQKNDSKRHGMSGTRIYRIWQKMKGRCYYKNDKKHYPHYGARGIKVCDEWKDDFTNFYNWAMENGYTDELTLDRIDVDGNYEPSNCRWATLEEQSYNKRNTLYVNIDNNKYTIKDLSDMTGLKKATIRYIYDREGEYKFVNLIKPYIIAS